MGAARAPGGGGREKLGWEHSGKTLNLVFNLFIYLFLKGLSIFPERLKKQPSLSRGGQPEVNHLPLLWSGVIFQPKWRAGNMWMWGGTYSRDLGPRRQTPRWGSYAALELP